MYVNTDPRERTGNRAAGTLESAQPSGGGAGVHDGSSIPLLEHGVSI